MIHSAGISCLCSPLVWCFLMSCWGRFAWSTLLHLWCMSTWHRQGELRRNGNVASTRSVVSCLLDTTHESYGCHSAKFVWLTDQLRRVDHLVYMPAFLQEALNVRELTSAWLIKQLNCCHHTVLLNRASLLVNDHRKASPRTVPGLDAQPEVRGL